MPNPSDRSGIHQGCNRLTHLQNISLVYIQPAGALYMKARWHRLQAIALSRSGIAKVCSSIQLYSFVFVSFRLYYIDEPKVDGGSDMIGCTAPRSVMTIRAHDNEVLSCDWCKYNENIIVTGSVDRSIRVWVSGINEPPFQCLILISFRTYERSGFCTP